MYDMDEMEIQRRVMTEVELKYLKDEKDKWHKKYNEALIKISMQAATIDQYERAIRRLIGERDMAIRDINHLFKRDDFCAFCKWEGECRYPEAEEYPCTWRGITPR